MMKIGIEAERANLPNPTGVEHYAAQLIKNLAKLDSVNQYVLYFRTKPQDWFYHLPKNFSLRVIPFPKFWTQLRLSLEMLTHPVDVLLILASALPIYHPKNSIATVHDIAFEMFPQAFTTFMRNYLIWSTRFAVRHAAKLITVSESTKNDMVKYYRTDAGKIEVVYLGLDPEFKPLTYEQVQPVLDKYGLVFQKYVLFVGTLQPRKNITRLVDAFIELKNKNHIEEKLAIVGGKGWLWQPIVKKIEEAGVGDSIKFLNYVPQSELPAIYAGSSLLTLPALYEGFGLPPLEAMACGVPVVVSNISSLPEVVGDAGFLVDPNSTESIRSGLLTVLTDKNLRAEMIRKGFVQAKKFTWQETAQKILNLFNSFKK
jgi:glycosyltransferase involved in cell wall biosynthesis